MAISASEIVQVVPRVLSGTGDDLDFNGLFLTTNTNLVTKTVLSFGSPSAVGEYFGTESDEYKAASVYFGGYANSLVKPGKIYFYRHVDSDTAPFLRGAKIDTATIVSELTQIAAGTLIISIDGTTVTISDLDFSSVETIAAACDVVQTALQTQTGAGFTAATVTFSSLFSAFVITGGTAGNTASITAATGTVAEALNLTTDAGATVSAGASASSYTDTMDAVIEQVQNFVTFSTISEIDDESVLELVTWTNTQANAGNQFLYVIHSTATALTQQGSTDTLADQIKDLSPDGTCMIYGSVEYAAFIMGAAASIAWDQRSSTITFKFKYQSGLAANVDDTATAQNLDAKGVNYMGNFATRNDTFTLLAQGSMFGQWAWIDTYLNSTWICNALQAQIMAGFKVTPRASYTQAGYALIRAWCNDVIKRAKNNGVIEAGVSLSDTQIAEIQREAGVDISDDLYNNGYYLQILDPAATIRQARETPTCNFWYSYGGAVHKLTLPATAIV